MIFNYHVTVVDTFIKRSISCAWLIDENKHLAAQYIDKQERVCWMTFTIFA